MLNIKYLAICVKNAIRQRTMDRNYDNNVKMTHYIHTFPDKWGLSHHGKCTNRIPGLPSWKKIHVFYSISAFILGNVNNIFHLRIVLRAFFHFSDPS